MKYLLIGIVLISCPALAVSVTMDTTSGHYGCCENSSSDASCTTSSITWVTGEEAVAIVYFYNSSDVVNTISGGAASWANVYNNSTSGTTFTNFYVQAGKVTSGGSATFSATGNLGSNNYMAACAFQLQNFGSFNTGNKNYFGGTTVTNPLSISVSTTLLTGGLAIGAIGEGAGSGAYAWTATTGTALTSPSGTVLISHVIMSASGKTIAADAPYTGTHNNGMIVIEADPPAGRNLAIMGVGQ